MNFENLFIQDYETPDDYRQRILALTQVIPILQVNPDAKTLGVIEKVTRSDPEASSRLTSYMDSPRAVDDMLAIYQLGVLMVLNPIQLWRYVDTIKALREVEDVVGLSSEGVSKTEQLFDDLLYVLADKASRARRLVEDFEGSEDNIHASEGMNGLRTTTSSLAEVRKVQSEMLNNKLEALKVRDRTLESLRQISDNERRSKQK